MFSENLLKIHDNIVISNSLTAEPLTLLPWALGSRTCLAQHGMYDSMSTAGSHMYDQWINGDGMQWQNPEVFKVIHFLLSTV